MSQNDRLLVNTIDVEQDYKVIGFGRDPNITGQPL